jgi:hypothetical protein
MGSVSAVAALFEPDVTRYPQTGFEVRFGKAPAPVPGGDRRLYMAYELHATAHDADVALDHVRVSDGSNTLLTYGPDELEGRTMRPELPRSDRYGRVVRSGTTAVVSVWLTLAEGRRAPRSLHHELRVSSSKPLSVTEDTRVDNTEVLVLGAPFRAGLWLAHNGPGDHRAAHWGSMLVHADRITVPQRYAIDFMGLDEAGRAVQGALAGSSNTNWPGFGREVIAVADGLVRDARDGIADNPPLFEPPPPRNVELPAVGGNYVLLDLGRSRYVHYVHLQQGSVTVAPGKRVRRGDVLGRLGNSGNTNGAHLHFNVVDGLRLAEAEGLPYAFDAYMARGTTTTDLAFGDSPNPPADARAVRRSIPLNGAMLAFSRT